MITTQSSQVISKFSAPDLRQRAPRSSRVRLGGFALLPRLLDKCRATIAGTNGEYHYACPLDQQFIGFVGVDAEKLKQEVAKGIGDLEALTWIQQNAQTKRGAWEIEAWSAHQDRRAPDSDPETAQYFYDSVAKLNRARSDIKTWADFLDLDDHVSFGGVA